MTVDNTELLKALKKQPPHPSEPSLLQNDMSYVEHGKFPMPCPSSWNAATAELRCPFLPR